MIVVGIARHETANYVPQMLPILPVDAPGAETKLNGVNFYGMQDEQSQIRADAEKLADIFTVLQRTFALTLSKELTRGQVSFPQYLLLGFLAHAPEPLTMTAIATRMRHTTAAATGLVDRLEKLGFARRQSAAQDRRRVLVHITAKGSRLVTNVREDMVANVVRLMGHLSPEDQSAWVRIYQTIFPHFPQ
jgi:DNA-binding MarR family transcriptional regulator